MVTISDAAVLPLDPELENIMSDKKKTRGAFAVAQRLGRSLMLPIATLPAAGLLVRLGQADMLGAEGLARRLSWIQPVADVFAAAGGAVFDNLPLIFAVGVAVGFAKKADGSTGVAALFGYLIYQAVTWVMSPIVMGKPEPLSRETLECLHGFDPAKDKITQVGPWNHGVNLCDVPTQTSINYGVLGGIVIGVAAALLWQRYYRVKLPDWLAFFGGRRFVPIITSGAALVIALVMSALYPAFNWLINDQLGGWLMDAGNSQGVGGALAVFVFGTVNRLLIPLGLHHLLNSVPWFQLGSCQTASGGTAHGDITCFFQGVGGSNSWTGSFMTGFFPIMMFALPAAALAIWRTAKPAKRKATGALMISVALTAFITGITEPLEYAFAYVAFPIYAIHAVLTGSSLAIANLLGAKDGFAFSAGGIDYLLNFGKSSELSGGVLQGPVMIIIMGLVYAVIYYFLFRFLIVRFNFKTPGREDDDVDAFAAAQAAAARSTGKEPAEPRRH
ncbi:EIICBA-Glc [Actinomyces viscosus]|uniref:EIICBA-Glc n=2 Tax=Actinomyces viscosus TaxID=1656 RepID=A0A3S4V239_ACTVI|nr:EIICBA-Glc [Actinomyces viscosus]